MSGADWAIIVAVARAVHPLDLPRRVGDRVRPHEPHPGASRSRKRATSARDGWSRDARAPRADAQRRAARSCWSRQLTSATLIGVLLEGTAGTLGVVLGIVLQIVLFFVIGEVAPKTFAVQHTERAALALTPMLWFLTNFAPLRWLSSLLIGIANVVLPGQGPEAGPVRHRGGSPHDGRRRRRARTPSSARNDG